MGSLVVFFAVGVRILPSLWIIHLAGIGGRNGVRRRAVSPVRLLVLGVVCITANVGHENSKEMMIDRGRKGEEEEEEEFTSHHFLISASVMLNLFILI